MPRYLPVFLVLLLDKVEEAVDALVLDDGEVGAELRARVLVGDLGAVHEVHLGAVELQLVPVRLDPLERVVVHLLALGLHLGVVCRQLLVHGALLPGHQEGHEVVLLEGGKPSEGVLRLNGGEVPELVQPERVVGGIG